MAELQAETGGDDEAANQQQQEPEKPEVVEVDGPKEGLPRAEGKSPVGKGNDGEHPDQERQADAFGAVDAQFAEAAALPEHSGKEAAEDEK